MDLSLMSQMLKGRPCMSKGTDKSAWRQTPMKWFILSSKAHQIDTSGTSFDTDWFLYPQPALWDLGQEAWKCLICSGSRLLEMTRRSQRGRGRFGEGRQWIPSPLFTLASDSLGASCLCSVGITHWQYWWPLCFGLRAFGPFILCQYVSAPHEDQHGFPVPLTPLGTI